jgi:SAM-dependent methyltransferase
MDKLKSRIKNSVKVLLGRVEIEKPKKEIYTPYTCNVCGQKNATFSPLPMHYLHQRFVHGYVHGYSRAETANFMNFTCNNCQAADRVRLYVLYLEKIRPQLNGNTIKILDIAPTVPFTNYLKKHHEYNIRTADLYADGVDDKVDIQKMTIYEDNKFDAFICSHVLEHVDDDVAGMKELYRVLKPGGWGILMVPILLELTEDYQIDGITTETDRWKHYGHSDHRRYYSKSGYVSKLKSAGFKIDQLGIDFFGKESFEKFAITETSVLYIVRK